MAITPLKVFLFALGGSTAVGLTAYVSGALDPYFAERPAAIAALPETGGDVPSAPAAQVPAAQPATAEPEGAAPAAQTPAAEAPAEGEPAADGQQSAEAPAAGVAPEGEAPVGDQVALNPQPETPAGQQSETPAAQQPGVPAAEPPAAAGEAPAGGQATPPEAAPAAVQAPSFDVVRVEADGSLVIAGKAVPNARVEVLSGSNVIGSAVADAGGAFVIVLDEPLKPGDYQLVLRATAPDGLVAMSVGTAIVSVPDTSDGQVLALVEEPGQPSKLITVPEPEKPASDVAAAGAEAPAADQQTPAVDAPAPAGEQPAAQGEAPAVAAAEPPAAEQPAAPSGLMVAVEAVEIEGRKVFVAGMAKAGHSVRVYANEILLGETRASPDNRFLIETEQELPVGDYIIRADLLAPDGSVVARAAVPFERQPGEAIAAVAPPAAPAETPAAAPAQEPAAAAPPTSEVAGQATAPAAPVELPATGAAQAPAAAPPPAGTEGSGQAGGEAAAQAEPTAPSVPGQASGEAAQAPGAASPAQQPAAAQPAPAESSVDVAVAPPAGGDAEALAPKLQNVDGAVIIRRGDTLWQISRRVYGKGMRFSTIFLANQEQIRDPNRIWPGQVFRVPEKSQDGREADLSRLGEQATTIEGAPAATE